MTRSTTVALSALLLVCCLQDSVIADGRAFRDVSPFSVHVSVNGSTMDEDLEKALTKLCLKELRNSKVPTVHAAPLADEKNPINNSTMDGLLAYAFNVRFPGDSETPQKVFADFMKENTGLVAKKWRRDNPVVAPASSDSGE